MDGIRTRISLINDCGCEIDNEVVDESQDVGKTLAQLLITGKWIVGLGDTIKIYEAWTED